VKIDRGSIRALTGLSLVVLMLGGACKQETYEMNRSTSASKRQVEGVPGVVDENVPAKLTLEATQVGDHLEFSITEVLNAKGDKISQVGLEASIYPVYSSNGAELWREKISGKNIKLQGPKISLTSYVPAQADEYCFRARLETKNLPESNKKCVAFNKMAAQKNSGVILPPPPPVSNPPESKPVPPPVKTDLPITVSSLKVESIPASNPIANSALIKITAIWSYNKSPLPNGVTVEWRSTAGGDFSLGYSDGKTGTLINSPTSLPKITGAQATFDAGRFEFYSDNTIYAVIRADGYNDFKTGLAGAPTTTPSPTNDQQTVLDLARCLSLCTNGSVCNCEYQMILQIY
jgi:hypothetical protein